MLAGEIKIQQQSSSQHDENASNGQQDENEIESTSIYKNDKTLYRQHRRMWQLLIFSATMGSIILFLALVNEFYNVATSFARASSGTETWFDKQRYEGLVPDKNFNVLDNAPYLSMQTALNEKWQCKKQEVAPLCTWSFANVEEAKRVIDHVVWYFKRVNDGIFMGYFQLEMYSIAVTLFVVFVIVLAASVHIPEVKALFWPLIHWHRLDMDGIPIISMVMGWCNQRYLYIPTIRYIYVCHVLTIYLLIMVPPKVESYKISHEHDLTEFKRAFVDHRPVCILRYTLEDPSTPIPCDVTVPNDDFEFFYQVAGLVDSIPAYRFVDHLDLILAFAVWFIFLILWNLEMRSQKDDWCDPYFEFLEGVPVDPKSRTKKED